MTKAYHTITIMKGCTPGLTTTINVGTIGHIDHLNAQRLTLIRAMQQIGVTAGVAAERLSELGDAFSQFEIHDEISDFNFEVRPHMLGPIEDVRAKPLPFWTQQGRHKKGRRGKY